MSFASAPGLDTLTFERRNAYVMVLIKYARIINLNETHRSWIFHEYELPLNRDLECQKFQ